jgi:hypothetical protein
LSVEPESGEPRRILSIEEFSMHFLLMCCFDEERWNALPAAQRDDVMQAYGAWIAEASACGKYAGGGKLAETASAACVTAGSGGKPTITDGPFAETKEQLGGYHLLDCADRSEALAFAARIPTLAVGGKVEVRALQHIVPGASSRP